MKAFSDWLYQTDPIELTGIVLSMIYLWLEIKAKMLMWLFGIVSSALMGWVFFKSGFYADMGLMGYYLIISIYGWIHWKTQNSDQKMPITHIKKAQTITSVVILSISYIVLLQILLHMPAVIGLKDSTYPYIDAFTVSASVVATWLLSQKVMEQWHIWIIVNIISTIMFALKGLHYTTILYVVYTIGSVLGLMNWSKDLIKQKEQTC